MADKKNNALSPTAMNEIVETDWNDAESVARLEAHACRLTALFGKMCPKKDADADGRARVWTTGVIVGAYQRHERDRVRPLVTALVERVTGGTPVAATVEQATEKRERKTAKRGRAR